MRPHRAIVILVALLSWVLGLATSANAQVLDDPIDDGVDLIEDTVEDVDDAVEDVEDAVEDEPEETIDDETEVDPADDAVDDVTEPVDGVIGEPTDPTDGSIADWTGTVDDDAVDDVDGGGGEAPVADDPMTEVAVKDGAGTRASAAIEDPSTRDDGDTRSDTEGSTDPFGGRAARAVAGVLAAPVVESGIDEAVAGGVTVIPMVLLGLALVAALLLSLAARRAELLGS